LHSTGTNYRTCILLNEAAMSRGQSGPPCLRMNRILIVASFCITPHVDSISMLPPTPAAASAGGLVLHWAAALLQQGAHASKYVLLDAGRRNKNKVVEDDTNTDRKSAYPVPENMPEVIHRKTAGHPYGRGHPLFRRQQHLAKKQPGLQPGKPVVPALSTTIVCTITLISTFFLLTAIFFVLQTLNRQKITERKREERCWANVVGSVTFVPMLCVLFLAARLQAVQYSQGNPELYGLPQWWVRYAMVVCTCAVLWSVLVHFCCEFLSDSREEGDRKPAVGGCMNFCRKLAMTIIYVCFTTVCCGVLLMEPPPELLARAQVGESWNHVSPGVACTVFLTVIYFAVYLSFICIRLANEYGLLGQRLRFSRAQEYLKSTSTTVAVFAPMLCALFLGTRIRLLQLDPLHGNPGKWVQMTYYGCSACFVLHTLLAVLSTYVDLREQQVDASGALMARPPHERGSKPVSRVLEALKLVLMGLIATGVLLIINQFFLAPLFQEAGRPLAPSLQCIALLTFMYFAVNLAHAIVAAVQRTSGGPPQHAQGADLEFLPVVEVYLRAAKDAVEFCPRFCILFIATLMRAFQLTNGRGAPQAWCQASQVVATGSIIALAFVRVDVLLSKLTAVCVNLQCLVLCLSCTAGIINVAALLVMTPESACGPGSVVAVAN